MRRLTPPDSCAELRLPCAPRGTRCCTGYRENSSSRDSRPATYAQYSSGGSSNDRKNLRSRSVWCATASISIDRRTVESWLIAAPAHDDREALAEAARASEEVNDRECVGHRR